MFVPADYGATSDEALRPLAELLAGRRTVALVGAGMSTESGIPDYRGPETARRARNPIQGRQFTSSPAIRARYWARSALGWPRVAVARPNAAHLALAALEQRGLVTGVITQNVDGLHQIAGSRAVVELHGALARVRCLGCGEFEARAAMQERLVSHNPGWPGWEAPAISLAPDGDADLEAACGAFRVPGCRACDGVLKPDVVFFGENVGPKTVEAAFALFDAAEVLLVLGSSLTVFSGFRFVRRAAEHRMPVAILNIGPTRGDELAAIRIDARLGDALPRLAELLGA